MNESFSQLELDTSTTDGPEQHPPQLQSRPSYTATPSPVLYLKPLDLDCQESDVREKFTAHGFTCERVIVLRKNGQDVQALVEFESVAQTQQIINDIANHLAPHYLNKDGSTISVEYSKSQKLRSPRSLPRGHSNSFSGHYPPSPNYSNPSGLQLPPHNATRSHLLNRSSSFGVPAANEQLLSTSEIRQRSYSRSRRSSFVEQDGTHRILLITVQDPQFPITTEVLYKVFSPFGVVEKIVIFLKTIGLQSLIQFQGPVQADSARMTLDQQFIYPGCCKLLVNYSRLNELIVKENGLRTRDFTNDELPAPEIDAALDPLLDDPHGRRYSSQSRSRGTSRTRQDSYSGYTENTIEEEEQDVSINTIAPSESVLQHESLSPPPLAQQITSRSHRTLSTPVQYLRSSSSLSTSGMTEDGMMSASEGSPVLLLSNLDEQQATCDAIFNLLSCYGNVRRVKKLHQKPDHALVQMENHAVALLAMSHLRGYKLFRRSLDMRQSKHWYIQGGNHQDVTTTHEDPNMKEYGRSQNRFIGKFANQTKYLFSPTPKLHISNLVAEITENELREHLAQFGLRMNDIKLFTSSNGHVQAFVQFSSAEVATDMLAKAHNTTLHDKFIKVAFSRNQLDEFPME